MCKITTELRCMECGNENLKEMDIMHLNEIGFPDKDWTPMAGSQCLCCYERVWWRLDNIIEDAVAIEQSSNEEHF